MKLEELFSLKNLNWAFYECTKQSRWKESTQRYEMNMLSNNIQLQQNILGGTYRASPTIDFQIHERGKIRNIEAPAVRDRIFQKVLSKKLLVPAIRPYLIYDNYASLEKRGTTFARKRFEIMLHEFYERYGGKGFVVLTDVHDYFGSVDHETLKEDLRKPVREPPCIMFYVDYSIDVAGKNGKGLNLGGECPQIYAVYYLHDYDNYFKIVRHEPYYGRYMDDSACLVPTISEARSIVEDATEQLERKKLVVNEKKTQIVSISHGFTYLQTKYSFNDGKLVTRPTRPKIVRERRRLKKYVRLREQGIITDIEVFNWYKGWRQELLSSYNSCFHTIQRMDALFYELFPDIKKPHKITRSQLTSQIFKEADYEDYRFYWEGLDGETGLY